MTNLLAYIIQDLLCAAVVSLIFFLLSIMGGFVMGVAPQALPTFTLYVMFGISLVVGFHLWGWIDSIRTFVLEE